LYIYGSTPPHPFFDRLRNQKKMGPLLLGVSHVIPGCVLRISASINFLSGNNLLFPGRFF
jgi:hypothetical protein